jgi:hypothetical protein
LLRHGESRLVLLLEMSHTEKLTPFLYDLKDSSLRGENPAVTFHEAT